MGLHSFTFQKLEKLVADDKEKGNKIKIGFIRRHKDNRAEMMAHPRCLCTDYIGIDARHVFFDYKDNNEAILCIEDYGNIDVSERCVDLLCRVNDELDSDILYDETSSWRVLVFDNDSDDVYELHVLTVDILTVEEEAIIQCRNCRRYC